MHRFERAGGGSDAHRRGGDDALQVRVLLEQGQRLVETGLVIIIAVCNLDQLHLRVFCQFLLHEADPGVLVRRRTGCRENGDLTRAIDLLRQQIHLTAANLLAIGLVDKDVTRVGRDIGVIAYDLDALRHRLLERGCDGVGVIAGDNDGADMLLGEGGDERHLRGSVGRGRANLLELAVQILRRLLAARGGSVKIRVVDLLGQEYDVEITAGPRPARRGTTCRAAGAASTGR